MASASTTIAVIFEALDRFTPTAAGIERSLTGMQKSADAMTKAFGGVAGDIESATQPLANLTTGVLKVEGAFLGAGVALTTFAIKTANDFDVAFRQISTLFDASEKDVLSFRNSILEYARTSSKSLEDITGALSGAIGAGVDYSKSIDLIATAEKLAVATRADLKGTTEVLVSTMNAYGIKTEESGKVADIFFQIIKDGKIEMSDLSRSLAMVTPVAAAAGVDLREVGAAVATLTAAGVQPSTAIEYLRSAISNIIKPSKDAAELAEELGIKFDAQALKSRGLAAVLNDVAKATGGNTGQMARLIGDVGGLTAALTLTGPAAQQFQDTLKNMGNATGSVATAFEKMSGSVEVATAKVNAAFKGVLIDIGAPLLEEAGGIANAIANIFNAIGGSVRDGALRDLVAYVETALGDLERTLTVVAQNLPAALAKADLSGFTKGIDTVRDAFSRLFGAIDLTSVDGLAKAIELAGAAFLGLSKFTGGVIDSFRPLFDLLVRMGNEAGNANPKLFEMAGQISGLATQANLLAGGLVSLLPAFEGLLGLILLRNGIGLLGSLKNLTLALPAMTSGITTLGVAITAYLASDKVIALVQALVEWKKATDLVAEANQRSADIAERAGPSLERFSQSTGIAVKSLNQANELIRDGTVVWSDAAEGWVKADSALAGVSKTAEKTVNPFEKANKAMLDAALASEKVAGGNKEVVYSATAVVEVIDSATGKVIGYEQRLVTVDKATHDLVNTTDKSAKSISEQAKEAEKAKEKADQLRVKLLELASNERIKVLEFRAALDIKQVEEQTKRIGFAFESLDKTISSTGDVISAIFGSFNESISGFDPRFQLAQNQIDKENALREAATKKQGELIDAQILLLRAQAEQMTRGDAIIKIDGVGLEPELEAIMWKILRKVQVTGNREGLRALLGLGV